MFEKGVSVHFISCLLPVLSKTATSQPAHIYYYHGDHLGSATWITDGNGDLAEYHRYLPYGETWYEKRFGQSEYSERFKFTGKERDEESGYDYFGARYFEASLLTSWISVDPRSDKYPSTSPYMYCIGNPLRYVDPNGMDLEQRETALTKANEYVEKNPNKNLYEYGKKGGPGEKVDCSGLVSNCIKAAGEQDPNYGHANGVANMASNSVEVNLDEVEAGNFVTFDMGKDNKYTHIGLVTDVTKNDNGEVTQIDFIHSGSSTGPTRSTISIKNNNDWNKWCTGFFKWDTYDAGQTKTVTIWGPPNRIPTPKLSNSPKISPNVSMIRMPKQ